MEAISELIWKFLTDDQKHFDLQNHNFELQLESVQKFEEIKEKQIFETWIHVKDRQRKNRKISKLTTEARFHNQIASGEQTGVKSEEIAK